MSPFETTIESTWPWPTWTAVLGMVVLLVTAWNLSRREPAQISRARRATLLGVRMLAFLTLIWMLGGWQRQTYRTEPAQLIIAVDNSASMSFADEFPDTRLSARRSQIMAAERSANQATAAEASRFQLARELLERPSIGWLDICRQDYLVKLRLLGDAVREVATDSARPLAEVRADRPASRLGQGVLDLLAAQQGLPTAAIVLLTDGATTSGPPLSAAAEAARRQRIPLYIVGMGGGKAPRDLRLADLLCDDVVQAGDSVQVSVQLIADELARTKATVRLKRSDTDEILAEQQVTVDSASARLPIRLTFRPETAGTLPLVIEAEPELGVSESNSSNNRLDHSLLVSDVAIKVLYVQSYPSYEFRFLKNLLSRATRPTDSSAKAFELTTVLQDADRRHAEQDPSASQLFPVNREELGQFDVVLIGDVDPVLLGRAAMDHVVTYVRDQGGSVVFLAGPRFLPRAYRDTALAQLFPFAVDAPIRVPDFPVTESFSARITAVGRASTAFRLVDSPAENVAIWNALPGLFWHLEIPEPSPGARILLEHPTRTGTENRPLPIVLSHYVSAGSVVFQATDETYRWSRHRGSDEWYSRYWLQTLRGLSRRKLHSGLSPAELSSDRQQYLAGEPIPLRVRFRRERPDLEAVTVSVAQPSGRQYTETLRRSATNQTLFTGSIVEREPGEYRVTLVDPLVEPAPYARTFSVATPKQEPLGVPRQTTELQKSASDSGGRYYDWSQADRIVRDLPSGVRLRVESLPPEPVWNSSLVAGLFVAILTVEWLVRRISGMP